MAQAMVTDLLHKKPKGVGQHDPQADLQAQAASTHVDRCQDQHQRAK
jgi:hypothetical protein